MLEKKRRLTKNGSFTYMYKNGKKLNGANLYVIYLPTNSRFNRFGFVVSNKIGKANVRNKVKRRLRAIVRANINSISKKNNYIFIVKETIKFLTFEQLKKEVLELLKKGGFLIENN